MRGLKENLSMRAGIKKIRQENIKRFPGQLQKKIKTLLELIVKCGFLKNIYTWKTGHL